MLDYSYERQLELLQQVRRGLADVTTSPRRIELQVTQLQQSAAKLQGQAQHALAAGREDLAREALTRRAAVTSQIGDLQGQQASLQAEQDKLTVAAQRLQAKAEAFRTRKETIKAAYTAAEAETRVNEAVTGISEEMGDVGMAIQRAQDKTEQMQARAGALDELLASGALEDATLPGGRDDLQSQLDALTAGHDVDDELARMKAQLPTAAPRRPSRAPGRHQPICRHRRDGRPHRECALAAPTATPPLPDSDAGACAADPGPATAAIHQLRRTCRSAGPAVSVTWVPDAAGAGQPASLALCWIPGPGRRQVHRRSTGGRSQALAASLPCSRGDT